MIHVLGGKENYDAVNLPSLSHCIYDATKKYQRIESLTACWLAERDLLLVTRSNCSSPNSWGFLRGFIVWIADHIFEAHAQLDDEMF